MNMKEGYVLYEQYISTLENLKSKITAIDFEQQHILRLLKEKYGVNSKEEWEAKLKTVKSDVDSLEKKLDTLSDTLRTKTQELEGLVNEFNLES